MRRLLFLPFLLSSLALPAVGTATAAPLLARCRPAGYSHNHTQCVVIPSHGRFSMKISGTKDTVHGTGTRRTAGTQITFVRVPPPVRARGGFGLRVRATGRFSPLKVTPGKLYLYTPAHNSLSAAKTIKSSGIYQVVG